MKNLDHLYNLLPTVYRQRDAEQGYQLKALLKVVTEQVGVVEDNIAQLYENWFIETCEEWVVPYIGDLVGYQLLNDAGEPSDVSSPRARQREQILIPRRHVANTIHARRRKGTLALLEELSADVAGWPARPGEYFRLLGWTQNLHTPLLDQARYHSVRVGDTLTSIAAQYRITVKKLAWLNPATNPDVPLIVGARLLLGWRPARGEFADLRDCNRLERIGGPFDRVAHTVDVRQINSHRTIGWHNIPSVGLFVWRLKSYPVTQSPAFCVDKRPNCYTFSVLGNDTPLYTRPQPEVEPTHIASELNLPAAIRRRPFQQRTEDYFGEDKSLQIWSGMPRQAIPLDQIVSADLSDWHYQPKAGQMAVDPVRGRFAFAPSEAPDDQVVWVSYRYAFSADIGGGEYARSLSQPQQHWLYRVGEGEAITTINDALTQWQQDLKNSPGQFQNVVIEITDSGLYEEHISLKLAQKQTLQIRAAEGKRPVISVPETRAKFDAIFISGDSGSRVTLDGLLIVGRGVKVSGPTSALPLKDGTRSFESQGDLCDVTIRHCTLVPGWSLGCDCEPCAGEEPSLLLYNTTACIKIEHSILGSIEVETNEAATNPVNLCLYDSIWDATDDKLPALNGVESEHAYVRLTIARCTVFGKILAHEIALAENCIFNATVCVARRQKGCVRFCYVPPDSRTPRRYECQPDLVMSAIEDEFQRRAKSSQLFDPTADELKSAQNREAQRVEPVFNSTRYGTPTYGQLANACATEISTGADDESEMGAFHDLYQPQRADNLRTRLDEYTPAGMHAGIIYAT